MDIWTIFRIAYVITVTSLWMSMLVSSVSQYGAFKSGFRTLKMRTNIDKLKENMLPISIIVPAHNEEKVIISTCEKILSSNYNKDLMQLIVINDASTDNSKQLLLQLQIDYFNHDIKIINTTVEEGGSGKSDALKKGIKEAKHDLLIIFDADGIPEKNSILFLVNKIQESDEYVAVVGRNKCRNKDHNLLTKLINLELNVTQKVLHAGNWELFKVGRIPGTNYIIKKDKLEEVGGFTSKSLTEDTDLSFKFYMKNYVIAYEEKAIAYQQEPEEFSTFFNQRARWAEGNMQVVYKNIKNLFKKTSGQFRLSIFYQFITHYWFFWAVLFSDIFFIAQIYISIHNYFSDNDYVDLLTVNPQALNVLIFSWAILFLFHLIHINFSLVTEVGESSFNNIGLSVFSYFTYSQSFLIVSVMAFFNILFRKTFRRKKRWYKTKRY